jgi:hypothetical protein
MIFIVSYLEGFFGWFLGGFWAVFGRFSCIENETLPFLILLLFYLFIKEVFSVIQK